ncbi:MAG: hypothetical protein ACQR33_03190 [Candidatus Saccharibacteria bacterium]
MSPPRSKLTPAQREASVAARRQLRQVRCETLKLDVVEGFLRGEISFDQLSVSGYGKGRRRYPKRDKVLVAWVLIMARPQDFGFELANGALEGSLYRALCGIYPEEHLLDIESLENGLHVKSHRNVKATPPKALITLVRKHISNTQGGIAKYFESQGQEPPTELDTKVIQAVLPPKETTQTPSAQCVTSATPEEHTASPSRAEAVAQRVLEELQELYGPKVLAELKRIL